MSHNGKAALYNVRNPTDAPASVLIRQAHDVFTHLTQQQDGDVPHRDQSPVGMVTGLLRCAAPQTRRLSGPT